MFIAFIIVYIFHTQVMEFLSTQQCNPLLKILFIIDVIKLQIYYVYHYNVNKKDQIVYFNYVNV